MALITTSQNTILTNGGSSPLTQVQANWAETNTASPAYIQNKPAIPAEQVQSDWDVTDTSSKAYIKNKPEGLPARPAGSYRHYSLIYSNYPDEMSMSWSLMDSRNMRLTEVAIGLDSVSSIVITQYMLDNHIAYIYLDRTKFPDIDGNLKWWDVKLWGMHVYKQTAAQSLAGTEWDMPLKVTTSPIDTPHNDSNTTYISTLRFKWKPSGLFTDYQGGLAFTVDLLNDANAKFIKLDLYGYTGNLAVGDRIYMQGSVRPCTNMM